MRVIHLFLILIASYLISGCSTENSFMRFPGVYKMDINQGNMITEKEINQLKPGMSKEQVVYIMGQPVLHNLFDKDRWDYVYSMQKGGKHREQKNITLVFENNKLSGFSGDLVPEDFRKSNNNV